MLDLYHEMQVNATLYEKLDRLTGALDDLHQKYGSNAPYMDDTAKIIYAIFQACDYNVGMLFPYFFPTAISGMPLSLMQRPFAFAMTKMHLFGSLTMRGSRQISKTTTFGAFLLSITRLISDISCLYICPRSDNLKTFQTKLKHLDRNFRYPEVETHKFRQNLGLKEYSNGSVIEAIYVNETADNARGKSADVLLWDESCTLNTLVHCYSVGNKKNLKLTQKAIVDVEVGDTVLSHDTHGKLHPAEVTRFYDKGLRHTWTVRYKNGHSLTCTANTKLWTDRGWMYLSEFLSPEEAARHPHARQAQTMLASCEQIYGADYSWRCVQGMEREWTDTFHEHFGNLDRSDWTLRGADLHQRDLRHRHVRFYGVFQAVDLISEYPAGGWTELESITYAGEQAVYDLEVEKYHTFFANGMAVHNCQNMDVNLLPELREIQTASKMPSNIYAGTSLTTDTMLEAKYEDSSQGTFWVKDGTAKGYIDCGDVDAILKMIKPQGLTCPTTNKPINIRDIRLVHKFQARADAGVVGIHVPKIIVPEFVEDPIEWNKLYGTFLEYEKIGQLKKFIQEVLGIPVEDGVRELTQADLEHMCCIPETPAQLEANVHRGVYKFTVAGIDWGGSDYNPADKTKLSYTFHIILGVRADGKIDILYMEKHAGMDYQGIINIIATMNKRYNVTYIGSDHAAGTLYNSAFRKHPHVKSLGHFVIQYSGNMLQLINKVKDSALENHYAVQKTDTLTDTIMAIKQEFPRIRCFKWELAKRYLDDFMNFRRVIEDRDEGGSKFRYRRHGSKPDDGIHALNFAYIVVRMVRNEPFVQDNSLRIEIYNQIRMITNGGNALAGYTPGMHTVSG